MRRLDPEEDGTLHLNRGNVGTRLRYSVDNERTYTNPIHNNRIRH